jgi:Tfp pilus assembly protein PilO
MNRERSFVYIGASVVVAIIVLLFLARPAYVSMLASKKSLNDVKAKEAETNQQLTDTKKLIADYASTPQIKIQDLNEHIPDFSNEADIIAELEGAGKNSHALVTSIRFNKGDKAVTGKTIYPLNVSIVVTGNYSQLKDFISSLEQNKRILNIGSASFASVSSSLTASINFTAYFSNINKPVAKDSTVPVQDQ